MSPILRIVLAVICGFFAGSFINMGIVLLGPIIAPPPPGVDLSTMDSMAASMHLMEPINFLFPFLAHALGTLGGSFVACLMVTNKRPQVGIGMAALFLMGGIAASLMIPAPGWFIALDLLMAYLPMAWAGYYLAGRLRPVGGSLNSLER